MFECVHSAKAEWYNIGLKLGLKPHDLDSIRGEDDECLRRVLKMWLQKSETLQPTWRSLLKALRSEIVGREDVAQDIEKYLKSKMETMDSTRQEESKEGSATEESTTHERTRAPQVGHGVSTAVQGVDGRDSGRQSGTRSIDTPEGRSCSNRCSQALVCVGVLLLLLVFAAVVLKVSGYGQPEEDGIAGTFANGHH